MLGANGDCALFYAKSPMLTTKNKKISNIKAGEKQL